MINEVSIQYAQALFDEATLHDEVADMNYALTEIVNLLDDDLLRVIRHPKISSDEKKAIFTKALLGQIPKDLLSFIYVLIDHHRLEELPSIQIAFQLLIDKRDGRINAQVFSKYPLDNVYLTNITEILKNKYQKNEIVLQPFVDEELIGGIKIVVGDEIIDDTALNYLNSLKDILKQ